MYEMERRKLNDMIWNNMTWKDFTWNDKVTPN